MSADEEFGRELGDRLRRELADVHADPGLAEALRARRVRRTWTIRAAVGAPLVAAAAAAAVLVATAGPATEPLPDGDRAAPPPSTTPQVANVAQVQQLTVKALRTAEDYVIHEKNTLSTGYLEYWTDRATDRVRVDNYTTLPLHEDEPDAPRADGTLPVPSDRNEAPSGPPRLSQSHIGVGPVGDRHYTTIDYDRKTWSTYHDTEPPGRLEVPDVLDADALKQAIDEGRMTMIGPEKIDGRDTHHLRLMAKVRGYQIDLWVDSRTYLPVRETSGVIDNPDVPVMTSDYDWLPRTEENLAKLTPTPPPGFVKQ